MLTLDSALRRRSFLQSVLAIFINIQNFSTIMSNIALTVEQINQLAPLDIVTNDIVRQRSGPKLVEIAKLTALDGVGIQKMENPRGLLSDLCKIDGKAYYHADYRKGELAKNDGLSMDDWLSWFMPYDPKPLAIIHFTSFRY